MSDCLHCDINELVRARLEQSEMIDLPDLAGKMAESLVDLILLAPENTAGSNARGSDLTTRECFS